MPHATTNDLRAVLDTRALELREDAAQYKSEGEAVRRVSEMMKRAVAVTGSKEITTIEAATVMAARGDEVATAVLAYLISPEMQLANAELRDAIEAHSQWSRSDDGFRCEPDCPDSLTGLRVL